LSACNHYGYGPGPAGHASVVYIDREPPPPRSYTRPSRPSTTAIWIDGYWNWTGVRFIWVDGYWERNPPPGRVWAPGGWVHTHRGWYRQHGRWVERRGR
jgi:hypothetical protein